MFNFILLVAIDNCSIIIKYYINDVIVKNILTALSKYSLLVLSYLITMVSSNE